MATSYTRAQGGASMMLAFRMSGKLTVIVGGGRLAASRALHALEADSKVVVLCKGGVRGEHCCEELRWRAEIGEVEVVDLEELCRSSNESEVAPDIESFLRQNSPVSLVCVTDTIINAKPAVNNAAFRRPRKSAAAIYHACRSLNIPINVSDMPEFCDFTFCATHRFSSKPSAEESTAGDRLSPLQIGLTTNGDGCRLAGRLKRELVAKVSKDAGAAVERVGKLRSLAKTPRNLGAGEDVETLEPDLSDETIEPSPNGVVPQRSPTSTAESDDDTARRRMKWVAQISEFWSLQRLACLGEAEMMKLLSDALVSSDNVDEVDSSLETSHHNLPLQPPLNVKGRIFLVGSGPGHPALLTVAARALLTSSSTHLILTDKLVPAGVLDIIPSHIEVQVARKFPGNAEGAQNELMELAVAAASKGKNVVRLKQGDPMVYGRAGEEVLHFRVHGFETIVIPGLSSAFAAPLCAGIPVTMRGVAESVVVCTGVGRGGKEVRLPSFERARTVVLLMGIARLAEVVRSMISSEITIRGRDGAAYPVCTPVAIIERAAMPDQRAIFSTLENVENAMESMVEQRPPGLLVVGWAVCALSRGVGETDILPERDNSSVEADEDRRRLYQWLGSQKWRVEEGSTDFLGILDGLS